MILKNPNMCVYSKTFFKFFSIIFLWISIILVVLRLLLLLLRQQFHFLSVFLSVFLSLTWLDVLSISWVLVFFFYFAAAVVLFCWKTIHLRSETFRHLRKYMKKKKLKKTKFNIAAVCYMRPYWKFEFIFCEATESNCTPRTRTEL